jgi:hypothetical protein
VRGGQRQEQDKQVNEAYDYPARRMILQDGVQRNSIMISA